MKWFLSIIFCYLFSIAVCFSESDIEKDKTIRNQANALSILATLGNDNKAQFAGFLNGIGMQFFFADYLAVRGSFGIDNKNKVNFSPKNSNLPNEEILKKTINFDLGVKFTFSETRNVVGYAGTNLFFKNQLNSISNEGFIENNPQIKIVEQELAWGWFLGGEYFPTDNISIAFEYNVHISRVDNDRKIGAEISQQISRSTRFGIDSQNLALILAFWIN